MRGPAAGQLRDDGLDALALHDLVRQSRALGYFPQIIELRWKRGDEKQAHLVKPTTALLVEERVEKDAAARGELDDPGNRIERPENRGIAPRAVAREERFALQQKHPANACLGQVVRNSQASYTAPHDDDIGAIHHVTAVTSIEYAAPQPPSTPPRREHEETFVLTRAGRFVPRLRHCKSLLQ